MLLLIISLKSTRKVLWILYNQNDIWGSPVAWDPDKVGLTPLIPFSLGSPVFPRLWWLPKGLWFSGPHSVLCLWAPTPSGVPSVLFYTDLATPFLDAPQEPYVLKYARGQWTLLEILLSEELCRRSCLTSMLTKVTRTLGFPFSLTCPFGNVRGLHLGASLLFPLFPSLPHTICYPRPCLRDSRSFSYHFSNRSFQTHPGAQQKQGDSVNNNGLLLERPCRLERA